MQIPGFLINKRLYPVWIAVQIGFNMANGDVIAMQTGNHNWGGNAGHQFSYSLNAAEFNECGYPDPKQPDPNATIKSCLLIPIPAAVRESGRIDHKFFLKSHPYLLYLLKRPPPPAYPTV